MSDKRDMSGVLFKNDRKEQPDHPDYEGSCTIDGKDYWMKVGSRTGRRASSCRSPSSQRRPRPMDEQMHNLEAPQGRSRKATTRSRSNVCAECRWISYGGRCNNTDRKPDILRWFWQ